MASPRDLGELLLRTVRKGRMIWPENRDPVEGYFELLKSAVEEEGADVNYQDSRHGDTALTVAVRRGDTETVRYLLGKGADPNQEIKGYGTPLMGSLAHNVLNPIGGGGEDNEHVKVTSSEFREISKLLIDWGADVNLKVNILYAHTPLIFAMWSQSKIIGEQILLLIEEGADLDIKDNCGNTALMHAARRMGMISRSYSRPEEDIRPPEDFMKTLIDHGANLDITNERGQTALMILLIQHGAKPEYYDGPFKAHVSAAAQYLIEAGADLDSKDDIGNNALIYAGMAELYDVARMILRKHHFEDKDYQDFIELLE